MSDILNPDPQIPTGALTWRAGLGYCDSIPVDGKTDIYKLDGTLTIESVSPALVYESAQSDKITVFPGKIVCDSFNAKGEVLDPNSQKAVLRLPANDQANPADSTYKISINVPGCKKVKPFYIRVLTGKSHDISDYLNLGIQPSEGEAKAFADSKAREAADSAKAAAASAKAAETKASQAAASAKTAETKASSADTRAAAAEKAAKDSATSAETSHRQAVASAALAANANIRAENAEAAAKSAEAKTSQAAASAKASEQQATASAASAKNAEVSARSAEVKAVEAAASAKASEQQATASAASAKSAEASAKSAAGDAKKAADLVANSPVEFQQVPQNGKTYLEWRRIGETSWKRLGELAKGEKGDKGDKGDKGEVGLTPKISVTARTMAPGQPAGVTQTGSASAPVFNFDIPRGDPGPAGKDAQINDNQTTTSNTWSAKKISDVGLLTTNMAARHVTFNNVVVKASSGNSSYKVTSSNNTHSYSIGVTPENRFLFYSYDGSGKTLVSFSPAWCDWFVDHNFKGKKIIGLPTPTGNDHAATKKYVDDKVGGVNSLVNTRDNSQLKLWAGTEAQLPSTRDKNTIYFVL